tara:strand:- start:384 stop:650 length:267 start_codon:yes stop_codon:yes gene_type:complete
MGNSLSELRDLKEEYETKLNEKNLDENLKENYQKTLNEINQKIEKNQIFRRYFNRRIEKSEICPSCQKEMYSHSQEGALECMREYVKN